MINFTPILFSPEVIVSIPRHKNIEKILIDEDTESREWKTMWNLS